MDIFKKISFKNVGHGGIKCHCCSDYRPNVHGKKSTMDRLRRITRRRLKQEDSKNFRNY